MDLKSLVETDVRKKIDFRSSFKFCVPKKLWELAFFTSSKTWTGNRGVVREMKE